MTDYICLECGYEGKRKGRKRGSTTIEVMLWLVFLFPGPFYSLWRILSKDYVCPHCKSKSMVPVNSPVGQRKLALLTGEIGGTETVVSSTESTTSQPAAKSNEKNQTPEAPPSIRIDDKPSPQSPDDW